MARDRLVESQKEDFKKQKAGLRVRRRELGFWPLPDTNLFTLNFVEELATYNLLESRTKAEM